MCACTKLPMAPVAPIEACRKAASERFEAACKEAGANNWGSLDDHDYDAASVEAMAKEASAYETCSSATLNAVTEARGRANK